MRLDDLGTRVCVLGEGRHNRKRYRSLFDETRLPKVLLRSRRASQRFYRQEHLRQCV